MKNLLAAHVEKIKAYAEYVKNEEGTITSMINPFLSKVLGYDVENPKEVIQQYDTAVAGRLGEKVDLVVSVDGHSRFMIEAKYWKDTLEKHDDQLARYFNDINPDFAILTNGFVYKIFTDTVAKNKMDQTPFYVFDVSNPSDRDLSVISALQRGTYDKDLFFTLAEDIRLYTTIKDNLYAALNNPDADFIRMLESGFSSRITTQLVEKGTPLFKDILKEYIAEKFQEQINAYAGKTSESKNVTEDQKNITPKIVDDGIVTTEDELYFYQMVRAILAEKIDCDRVVQSDNRSYFVVNIDGKSTKWVCRLFKTKDAYKMTIRNVDSDIVLDRLEDVYKHRSLLLDTALNLL